MTSFVPSIAYNVCMIGIFAAWLWFLHRRRDLWLCYTAKEAAFWSRLRIPESIISANRRFAEGSGIICFAATGLVIGVLLLILSSVLQIYFYGGRSNRQPNKALQRTAADRRGFNPGFSAPLSLSFRR